MIGFIDLNGWIGMKSVYMAELANWVEFVWIGVKLVEFGWVIEELSHNQLGFPMLVLWYAPQNSFYLSLKLSPNQARKKLRNLKDAE